MSNEGEARVFEAPEGGGKLPYRLFLPANHDRNKEYPLVLFFHGSGERGDDNLAQLTHGAGRFTSPESQAKFPSFLIAPQCPAEGKWVDIEWSDDSGTQPARASRWPWP